MIVHELAPKDLRWVDGNTVDLSITDTAKEKLLRLLEDRPEGPVLAMILGLVEVPKPPAPVVLCPDCGRPIKVARVTNGAMTNHRRSHLKAVAA